MLHCPHARRPTPASSSTSPVQLRMSCRGRQRQRHWQHHGVACAVALLCPTCGWVGCAAAVSPGSAGMTIAPDLTARIRRLYEVEHWRVGTIATQLHVHRDNARLRTDVESERPDQGRWSCRPTRATPRPRSQPSRTWGSRAQPQRQHRGTANAVAADDIGTTSEAELGRRVDSQALVVSHAGSEASACIGGQPWCVTLLTSAPALARHRQRRRRRQQAVRAACLSRPPRLSW